MIQRQAKHRKPETKPYPYIDPDVRDAMDEFLEYFESVANTAYQKLRSIPKEQREDWYERQVQHWKSMRAGFRLARYRNRTTSNNAQSSAVRST